MYVWNAEGFVCGILTHCVGDRHCRASWMFVMSSERAMYTVV